MPDTSPTEDPPLTIRLFGQLEVSVEGRPLPPLRSRATLWLLALLALHYDQPRDRDGLARALWPVGPEVGREQSQALANLRQRLGELRRALGTQSWRLTAAEDRTLRLNLEGAEVDLIAFDAAIRRGDPEALERAVSLYRGPLLENAPLEIEAIRIARARRKERYRNALRRLSEDALERKDPAAAARYLRLEEEETVASPSQGRAAESADKRSVPTSDAWALRVLPQMLTSLVGREQEIAEVQACLRLRRLVTLTGTGGVGKTRLAIATASTLAEQFADGVCLVDMAAVRDPLWAPQAVATALKVREQPERKMIEALVETLQERSLLLTLDNCEHLLAACAELAGRLLAACGRVRILATSRQALGVLGEQQYRVDTLPVPDLPHAPEAEPEQVQRVREVASVQLFLERAALVQPGFALTTQNAAWVAQICRQLDGIPLAIELAAARMGAMGVEEIAVRLQHRFRLLTGGNRSALPRHQTLRAAIDWSYDLLSEPERRLLRRLSVFVGGWTLAAAEQVCADTVAPVATAANPQEGAPERRTPTSPEADLLDSHIALIDRSLALVETKDGQTRYRMLETLREYAAEKLAASREETRLRQRHQDWYLALVAEVAPKHRESEQTDWLEGLEREHDNLRAALAWGGAEAAGAEKTFLLAISLVPFWKLRGFFREGRQWLEAAADPRLQISPRTRADALHGVGTLALLQGDYPVATDLLEKCLELRSALGDREGEASTRMNLGIIAIRHYEHARANALFESSVALRRECGDWIGAADALVWMGNLAQRRGELQEAQRLFDESLTLYKRQGAFARQKDILQCLGSLAHEQGQNERALALYEECLAFCRQAGNRGEIARIQNNRGNVLRELNRLDEAEAALRESLTLWRELGNAAERALTLDTLGMTHCARGDYAAAVDCLQESWAYYWERMDREGLAYTLMGQAEVALGRAHPARATFLLAQAQRERTIGGASLPASDQRDWDRLLAHARSALDPDAFEEAWRRGDSAPLTSRLLEEAAE